MTAFCNSCGNALPPAARFCSGCGTVVNSAPPSGFPNAGYPPYPPRPVPLVRPLFGRRLAGVCAGLARTYGWELGTIRVLTILGAIFLCPIVEITYIAFWIAVPEEVLMPMQPPPPLV